MNALKAICIPRDGCSSEFDIPMDGPNIAHIAKMAKRARELHEGLKSLRATNLLTDDCEVGRLAITSGQGHPTFGFDFQKISFDCSDSTPLNVVLQDERRQRSLSIRLQPASLDALAKQGEAHFCASCSEHLADAEVLKGATTCHGCVVKGLL
jgi:hypothetical protein